MYNLAVLQFAMLKNQLVLICVFFFLFLLHSVQGGINALGKAYIIMRPTPSLRSVPNVAFATVTMLAIDTLHYVKEITIHAS